MDPNAFLNSLPAIIALLFKIGIFFYARASGVHNHLTRLYLYFLFALSIQNVAEISHFYTLARGAMPYLEFTVYYAAITAAIALLLHLALTLAVATGPKWLRPVVRGIYLYAAALVALFIFTPWLIADLTRIGYTATRVPGPLYGAFELYAIGGFLGAIGVLAYGTRHQDAPHRRAKAGAVLLAIIPMVAVIVTVLILLRLNIRLFNATVINPIAITYFLGVTAYAIHKYRLFDIQFYIPWSKVRTRKTAFYERIRAMIAEIADLGSAREAVTRLGDTLRCPVALMSTGKPVLAVAGGTQQMVAFPLAQLHKIERITVANEIADVAPDTYRMMRAHGVAAIVPFYPHSQSVSGWMLLGDAFSEQVYTPLDFKMVEQLFARLADLFLDKMVSMRTQLAEAQRGGRMLEQRAQVLEQNLSALREENHALRWQNQALMEEHMANAKHTLLDYLDAPKKAARRAAQQGAEPPPLKALDEHLGEYEARLIEQTLESCGGNQAKAARLLGLKPNTLHYKLERYGLAGEKKRQGHKATPPKPE